MRIALEKNLVCVKCKDIQITVRLIRRIVPLRLLLIRLYSLEEELQGLAFSREVGRIGRLN